MQTSCSFSFQNLLHLIDLRLLASDDAAATLPDFGIRKLRLLAHQDSARMMGNHHPEKSRVADRCLGPRSEEHTSELQSLMRISYAVLCLKKKTNKNPIIKSHN